MGPAKGPTIAIGIINANTEAPTHAPDSVISYIMKGDAIPCSQPPLLEAKPANQNRRKSCIRSAEIASDNFGRDRFWDNSLIYSDSLPYLEPARCRRLEVCSSEFSPWNYEEAPQR